MLFSCNYNRPIPKGQTYTMEELIMGTLLLFIGLIIALVVDEYKKRKARKYAEQQEAIRQFLASGKKN